MSKRIRGQCDACRRQTGARFLMRTHEVTYVEGYPLGCWGRFEKGSILCLVHSMTAELDEHRRPKHHLLSEETR